MGLVFNRGGPSRQQRYWGISSPADLIPPRSVGGSRGMPVISNDSAMRQSAVWAALRIRADLISTMPVSSYRNLSFPDGTAQKVYAPLSPFMSSADFMEWMYSSQIELDRSGNSVGIITDVDGQGFPANIDLQPSSAVTVLMKNGNLKYKIDNVEYGPEVIWHEKQYTVSGLPVGLSPVAYAALTLGQYRTIQDFASDWFISGTLPRAQLRNAAKKLNSKEAAVVKESWRASRAADEPFVTGNDWEYSLIQAQQSATEWIDAMKMSLEDAARFFGVPADLIDAAMGGPNITYANVVQRNLQFLIMHLGPAIRRRENALGKLLPRPRLVQLDRQVLLEMDPMTLATWIRTKVDSRVLAPSEAREMDNRPPFTTAQIEEFDKLGLNRRGSTPFTSISPVPVMGAIDLETGNPVPDDTTISYPTSYTSDPDAVALPDTPDQSGTSDNGQN